MANQPRPENRAHPVRMEDELWDRVKSLAKAQEASASDIVRTAVTEYVDRHDPKETP